MIKIFNDLLRIMTFNWYLKRFGYHRPRLNLQRSILRLIRSISDKPKFCSSQHIAAGQLSWVEFQTFMQFESYHMIWVIWFTIMVYDIWYKSYDCILESKSEIREGELFNQNENAFYLFEPLAAIQSEISTMGCDKMIDQKIKYVWAERFSLNL